MSFSSLLAAPIERVDSEKGGQAGTSTIPRSHSGGGKINVEFDWEVKAVRKGHEDYKPVRPWDEGYDPSDRERIWAGWQKRLARAASRTP